MKDVDKNLFMETLRSAAQAAAASEKPIAKEEIAAYFKDMDLSDEQQELVYQYLQKPLENHTESAGIQENCDIETAEVELPKTVFFQMYLEDIRSVQVCTPQEEEAWYQRLAAGEDTAVQQLSGQWLARVLQLARKLAPSTEELADVVQEGNMGIFLTLSALLGAGRQMDYEMYQKTLEDAAKEAMEAYLLDTQTAEDMQQSILAKAALVHEAQAHLAEEFQRVPTMEELSQYTKLTVEELEDILAMSKEK